ncbi:PREDICTED: glutathione S-transferase U8 [Tarenaya hassleriana]|uniref:glutathione S-transferase U8 n=1 Tax=Tarenaya hassleriana TaxID=28532 RepID=UPI00053C3058|nr:PREDICTED: glutathione S-transferase U8 [Tarenaya hassleriana]
MGLWGSPFSKRVEMAVRLKGVSYEYMEEDVYKDLRAQCFHKKVPVLLHNSNPVVQSLVILQYIDDVWSRNHPILPGDPYDHAMARVWAKYVDDKVCV